MGGAPAAVTIDRRAVWAAARDVLAVRLDAAGDVLMTTPALRAVKEASPGRRLTLLTSTAGAQAARLVPEIDDVVVYDAPWVKASPARRGPEVDLAAIEDVRRTGFDAAVIFTVFSQDPMPAAMFCYLAGIPLRLAHTHDKGYRLLTDPVADPEPESFLRHEVRRQLDLVATIGCRTDDEDLSVRVGAGAAARVADLLADVRIGEADRPWAVLHPGASAPSRRYPAERFAEVARRLIDDHGWDVVLAGSEADRHEVETIRRGAGDRIRSLSGKLDLEGLAALLASAPLLIANNSAPAHLAAAVGTPVVDLYALTNLQHTPWRVPHRVLFRDVPCRNCASSVCPEGHHACLRLVEPNAVVEAAVELAQAGDVASPSDRRYAPRLPVEGAVAEDAAFRRSTTELARDGSHAARP